MKLGVILFEKENAFIKPWWEDFTIAELLVVVVWFCFFGYFFIFLFVF